MGWFSSRGKTITCPYSTYIAAKFSAADRIHACSKPRLLAREPVLCNGCIMQSTQQLNNYYSTSSRFGTQPIVQQQQVGIRANSNTYPLYLTSNICISMGLLLLILTSAVAAYRAFWLNRLVGQLQQIIALERLLDLGDENYQ